MIIIEIEFYKCTDVCASNKEHTEEPEDEKIALVISWILISLISDQHISMISKYNVINVKVYKYFQQKHYDSIPYLTSV